MFFIENYPSGGGEFRGEKLLANMDGRTHEALPQWRDAITARTRELGDEAMGAQQAQEPADAAALAATFPLLGWSWTEQMACQLLIAKAAHGVFAAQYGLKQSLIVTSQRLQGATVPPLIRYRRAAALQFPLADAQVVNDRQRLQITRVSLLAHVRIPV